jgi:hypothetical protein
VSLSRSWLYCLLYAGCHSAKYRYTECRGADRTELSVVEKTFVLTRQTKKRDQSAAVKRFCSFFVKKKVLQLVCSLLKLTSR